MSAPYEKPINWNTSTKGQPKITRREYEMLQQALFYLRFYSKELGYTKAEIDLLERQIDKVDKYY